MAADQNRKVIKDDITYHHIGWMSIWCDVISPFWFLRFFICRR